MSIPFRHKAQNLSMLLQAVGNFLKLRSLSNTKRRERKGLMKSLLDLCYWDLISSKMHRKASVPMFGDVTLI